MKFDYIVTKDNKVFTCPAYRCNVGDKIIDTFDEIHTVAHVVPNYMLYDETIAALVQLNGHEPCKVTGIVQTINYDVGN